MIGAVSGYTTPKEMKGSVTLMTQRQKALLSCAVAAALLLSGCRKGSSDSGSMSSSNAMSGSSGSASTTQTGGWKTGLGILTEASDEARTGTIHTIAAAVLLDGDGKLADVMLDELEVEVTADGKGVVTMPTDYRTKRQKGGDYPLAAASSLKKGWAEQADDFADYLTRHDAGAGIQCWKRIRTARLWMPTCCPAAPSGWISTATPWRKPARMRPPSARRRATG